MTCESCQHMRGKLRVLRGKFDFRGFSCSCIKGILWNEYQKAPKIFQLGSQASMKNYSYETWNQANRCIEYQTMD